MAGYHNITLKLMWFADNKEWRIYSDAGQYTCCKELKDLPQKVAELLRYSAEATLRRVNSVGDPTDGSRNNP